MKTWKEYMRLDEVMKFRGKTAMPKKIVGDKFAEKVVCEPSDDLSGISFIACDLTNLHMSKEQFLSLASIKCSIAPKITLDGTEELDNIDLSSADTRPLKGLTLNQLWCAKDGFVSAITTKELGEERRNTEEYKEWIADILSGKCDPDVGIGKHWKPYRHSCDR